MRARISLTLVVLAIAACDERDRFPGGSPPGGGPPIGGGTGGIDGGFDEDGGVPVIGGVVCQVDDLRLPGNCVAVRQSGMPVTLKRIDGVTVLATTRTDANGLWAAPAQKNAGNVVVVVEDPLNKLYDSAQLTVVDAQGAARLTIPMVNATTLDEISVASRLLPLSPGTGVVAVLVVQGDGTFAGATLDPLRGQDPYYDTNNSAFAFTTVGPTTANGFAVWFDLPQGTPGPSTFRVRVGQATTNHSTIVEADAIVFTTVFL